MKIEDIGGLDLDELVTQAQQMQSKVQEAQERAQQKVVVGEAGGGMVQVKVNGRLEVTEVTIDAAVVDVGEIDMLQDLVVAATNVALDRARNIMSEELGPLARMLEMGGIPI